MGGKDLRNGKTNFARKFCKAEHSADLAFEYINQIKLYIRTNEVEVNEIVDLEFLRKIDPDYVINFLLLNYN